MLVHIAYFSPSKNAQVVMGAQKVSCAWTALHATVLRHSRDLYKPCHLSAASIKQSIKCVEGFKNHSTPSWDTSKGLTDDMMVSCITDMSHVMHHTT